MWPFTIACAGGSRGLRRGCGAQRLPAPPPFPEDKPRGRLGAPGAYLPARAHNCLSPWALRLLRPRGDGDGDGVPLQVFPAVTVPAAGLHDPKPCNGHSGPGRTTRVKRAVSGHNSSYPPRPTVRIPEQTSRPTTPAGSAAAFPAHTAAHVKWAGRSPRDQSGSGLLMGAGECTLIGRSGPAFSSPPSAVRALHHLWTPGGGVDAALSWCAGTGAFQVHPRPARKVAPGSPRPDCGPLLYPRLTYEALRYLQITPPCPQGRPWSPRLARRVSSGKAPPRPARRVSLQSPPPCGQWRPRSPRPPSCPRGRPRYPRSACWRDWVMARICCGISECGEMI